MTNPKKILIDALADVPEDASVRDVQIAISRADRSMGADRLFYGWARVLVNAVVCLALPLAVVSAFLVQSSKEVGLCIYAFWALAPPAWFFIEWVWLFRSRGDAHRLNQFKTTIELSQKFWGGTLVLFAIELLFTHNFKV